MIFDNKDKYGPAQQSVRGKWRRWFAWYPVRLKSDKSSELLPWVWLEWVERRQVRQQLNSGGYYWFNLYRIPPNDPRAEVANNPHPDRYVSTL